MLKRRHPTPNGLRGPEPLSTPIHAITDGAVIAVCGLRRREIVLAYRAFRGGHPQRARHPSAHDVAHHRLHGID
jgi:hypothetical protein